jgi:hypothetical protein
MLWHCPFRSPCGGNLLKLAWQKWVEPRARICKRLRSLGIDSEGIDSASLCSLAGRYDKQGYRTGPPDWESKPGLLKRFTNTGSDARECRAPDWKTSSYGSRERIRPALRTLRGLLIRAYYCLLFCKARGTNILGKELYNTEYMPYLCVKKDFAKRILYGAILCSVGRSRWIPGSV